MAEQRKTETHYRAQPAPWVSPNLIRNISRRRRAVAPHNAQIHQSMLHEMSARIVHNHRMWHTMLPQFPRRKTRPLIPRPRLIHPNMHRNSPVMRRINRRRRRPNIHSRQPPRVAMGQDVYSTIAFFSPPLVRLTAGLRGRVGVGAAFRLATLPRFNQRQPMPPNRTIDRNVLLTNSGIYILA
jgi:hypothetical protein